MLTLFTPAELREVSSSLEDYHKVFYTFFSMASVSFCDVEVPTACVRFHPLGKPDLLINRDFWASLTHRERLFVICHECLHVILLHDERMGTEVPGATQKLINIAQDITINEMIVSVFGFDREDIRDWKRFCWIETCFKYPQLIKRDEIFTYYLELLTQQAVDDLPELFDDHSSQGGGLKGNGGSDRSEEKTQENRENLAGQLAEELDPEELEALINGLNEYSGAGLAPGIFEAVIGEKRARSKINFIKIIRHLKRSRIKIKEGETESFVAIDRRFDDVMRHQDVSVPGKHPHQKKSRDRLLTALFMDVSGSVIHMLPFFNKIYAAFDHEREIFEIRAFGFDTRTFEILPGQRVGMGGGTRFDIIEQRVQELKLEYGKYPDCVVVVTDGEGCSVAPEIPKRWVWMLTPNPDYQYIHKSSKKLSISDVVF